MIKLARMLYLIFAWLFPLAILIQVLFVGLSLFTGQPFWDIHMSFGHMLALFPLLMVILMYLARLPRSAAVLTWIMFGTYLVQAEVFAAIRESFPGVAAFHPALALVLFSLAVVVALQARGYGRTTVVQTAPAQQEVPV